MPVYLDDRRRSPRHKAQLNARLLFSVSLVDSKAPAGSIPHTLNLVGQTRDISEIGLGLIVPIAQIDERYLAGEGNTLKIELYLPTGPVEIHATLVRYERLSEGKEKSIFNDGYIIGAQITKVSDRARFLEYLHTLE